MILEGEKTLKASKWPLPAEELRELKGRGWTDRGLSAVLGITEEQVRLDREKLGVHGTFPFCRHLRGRVRGEDALSLQQLPQPPLKR